jgi:hypothetical protein
MLRQRIIYLVALSALLLFSGAARAQQPSSKAQAAASELYNQARSEMEAGDYVRACPRLEAAKKILPEHVRTGMTLAQCYDKSGQPASALAELMRVKPLAESQGKADKVAEIQSVLADLERRVPRLTIEVRADLGVLPGLTVTRNGVPVTIAQWGKAEPVDPGVYEIGATALGKAPWTTRVEVKGEGETVSAKIEPPWIEEKKEVRAAPVIKPPPPPPQKRLELVVAGAGLAAIGIGVGVGFTLASNGKSSDAQTAWDDLRAQGGPGACLIPANAMSCDAYRSAYDGREVLRSVAIGGYVAGGVFALGTVVYALMPSAVLPRGLLRPDETAANGARVSVSITSGGGGAAIEGVF